MIPSLHQLFPVSRYDTRCSFVRTGSTWEKLKFRDEVVFKRRQTVIPEALRQGILQQPITEKTRRLMNQHIGRTFIRTYRKLSKCGAPLEINTDNGPQYAGKQYEDLCRLTERKLLITGPTKPMYIAIQQSVQPE